MTTRPSSSRPPATRTTSTGRRITTADAAPERFTVPGTIDFQYDEYGVYRITSGKDGKQTTKRLLEWCPVVLERQDEMGTERGRRTVMTSRYVIQVGDVVHTATMDELHDGSIWSQFPDATGTGSRTVKDVLENIVRAQGKTAPLITELVARSGWHTMTDGRTGYLYPNDTVYPADFPLRLAGRPAERMVAYCRVPDAAMVDAAPEHFTALAGDLITHAGPTLLGIPAGVRAMVTTMRHPRTSLLLDGPRGKGKSSCEWFAGALVTGWGWPLAPTASFKDALGAIETKIGSAGDIAVNVDDSQHGANASNTQDSQANDKLEMVIRSAETGGPIRDRQDRNDARQLREGNSVHGLAIVSVEHLPRSMRGSLMRRCVIVKYGNGNKVDTRWMKVHSDRVGHVMRAIGERVIRYVQATDHAELATWLRERAALHFDALMARIVAERADWDESVDSIVDGAAEIAAGHDLMCAALGIESPEFAEAIATHLVAACLHTAELAADEFTGSDDLSTALADLIVKSLLGGRAHVADSAGKAGPHLPELSPGEQGVRTVGDIYRPGEWIAVGPVPLYYLPDRYGVPVIGVRSTSLYELVKLSGDPRLSGLTARSLPGRLAETGAVLASEQEGTRGTWKVWDVAGGSPRLVLIPLRILGIEGEPGGAPAPATDPTPSVAPEILQWVRGTLEVIPTLPAHELVRPELTTDIDVTEADGRLPRELARQLRDARDRRLRVLELAARPILASAPAAVATPAPVTIPTEPVDAPHFPAQRRQQRPAAAPEPAATAPVYVIAGERVITAEGEQQPAPADLVSLLRELSAGRRGEALVILTEPKAYGLTGAKPAPGKAWHKGFTPADKDGWHGEAASTRKPHVSAWTSLEHPEHGIVRLCVLPWLVKGEAFPLSTAEVVAGEQPEPAELIRRMGRFHSLIGQSYRGTRANTAVRLLRDLLGATARGGARYQGSADITSDMDQLEWTWDAPDVAALAGELPRMHGFDGNKNHLYPTREVRLCLGDLEHTGPLEYDPRRAGLFLIDVPEWPYPMLPAPTSQTGRAWVTGPILKRYDRLGFEFTILESLSGPGVQPQATRRFVEIVAHALTEFERQEDDAACAEATKGLYQTLHGKLRSQSAITRHDWGLAIRDESWCNTLDKVYRIAGLEQVGDPIRGAVPAYVDMDEIVYPTAEEDHAGTAGKLGGVISIGRGLGQFKTKTDMSVSEWIQSRKDK